MNSRTFNKIIQLNNDFYKEVGEDFSRTRQNAWQGWGRVVKAIKKRYGDSKKVSILDLGCGNGRFLSYLGGELGGWEVTYTGLDTEETLLRKAMETLKVDDRKVKFKKFDVIQNIFDANIHCDVVVAFGITHHIPSSTHRQKWFNYLPKLLNKNALLCLTFWQMQNDPRFVKTVRFIKTPNVVIKKSELEDGDYFYGWAHNENVYRYIHVYDDKEIENIRSEFLSQGLTETMDFLADGRTNTLNRYLIFANDSFAH